MFPLSVLVWGKSQRFVLFPAETFWTLRTCSAAFFVATKAAHTRQSAGHTLFCATSLPDHMLCNSVEPRCTWLMQLLSLLPSSSSAGVGGGGGGGGVLRQVQGLVSISKFFVGLLFLLGGVSVWATIILDPLFSLK